MTPEFLTTADVIAIHAQQREVFGGAAGVRDRALLESAVAQPRMTFEGSFIHPDIFAMAAAYLFHVVRNHAFVDGSKRVGLLTALVFLEINGVSIATGSDALYRLTMDAAEGRADKEQITATLRRLARES